MDSRGQQCPYEYLFHFRKITSILQNAENPPAGVIIILPQKQWASGDLYKIHKMYQKEMLKYLQIC